MPEDDDRMHVGDLANSAWGEHTPDGSRRQLSKLIDQTGQIVNEWRQTPFCLGKVAFQHSGGCGHDGPRIEERAKASHRRVQCVG